MGVGVGVAIVNVNSQRFSSCAAGRLVGAVGATASSLVLYSLTAVKMATPANTIVANIINIVDILDFFIVLLPS